MISNTKIVAQSHLNGIVKACNGEISILEVNDKSIFASWKLLDKQGQLLASKSRHYFTNGETFSIDQMNNLIIKDILNYRIARSKIFFDVMVMA